MEELGKRLRELRKKNKQTLKQIAEKTDLSISFLSQVEHGRSSVTLESLMRISECLNVNPSYFFADQDELDAKKQIAVNKKETMDEDTFVSNFIYKDLSGKFSNQSFLPTLVTLQPRKNGVRPLAHTGQEFIYVLEGTLSIIFENEEIDLHAGESIHMESTIPHNWLNRTEQTIKLLYVSSN
ncbi:helix-turn-helix domain-containing protein [Oceanobacillus neutriphilus]|uniref:DNA-binding protein n=1 Tax=Oceanobacillus neutriphilus TaxID=531815 RepID=A0ABQ2NPW8_9BACI|nr:XRE family transcriptional regulator [Oceanobacillus neutriphilus]GGP07793.1 DNA-binding protein [Oceanobacillus neutriphilus]